MGTRTSLPRPRRRRVLAITAGLVAASLGTATLTAPPVTAVNPPVTITVDRGAPVGTFQMEIGQTHTQKSLEVRYGDPDAVARGKVLLGEAVSIQNQHIYGWGARNPNPAPGVFFWDDLDERVALMRDVGGPDGLKVITLCCGPDWMTELGTETSRFARKPPTARHYDEFAQLAKRIARRYPDVTHFVVWNEMKGFWNPGAAQWDYVAYTAMYNEVYDALKSVNPEIQVGGPYLVIESTGSERGGQKTQQPVTQRNRVLLEYWMEHGRGADFVAIDRKVTDYHDTNVYSYAEKFALSANFAEVARQVGEITGLPVWFIEQHFVGQRGGPVHLQAAGIASMLYHQLEGGSAVTVGWKPEQDRDRVQENLYTSSLVEGGAQILPPYWSYRFFNELSGQDRYGVASSDPEVLAVASDTHTVVINQHPGPIDIDLDGTTHVLQGWEVARFDATGNPAGTSTDALDDEAAQGGVPDPIPRQPADARQTDALFGVEGEIESDLDEHRNEHRDERHVRPDGDGGADGGADDAAKLDTAFAASPTVDFDWLDQLSTAQSDRLNAVVADGSGVFVGMSTWDHMIPDGHRGLNDGFVRRYDRDGNVVWSNQFGSRHGQGVSDLAVDATGVYAVGTTDGPVAGQPDAGWYDVMLRAYDRSGRLRWTRTLGTDGDDHGKNVVVRDGLLYVTGHTDGRFPGQTLAGAQDPFLSVFTIDGEHLWTRQYGTEHPDYFSDLALDGDTLWVSGLTAGDFAGNVGKGHWDALIARLDLDGNIVWSETFGTVYDDRAEAIAVADDGIRIAGRAENSIDGSTPYAGIYDGFVRSYSRTGDEQWTTMIATPFFDRMHALTVDASGTHAIGATAGDLADPTATDRDDVVLATLDTDGQILSIRQLGTAGTDEPTSISTDLGTVFVGGTTQGQFDGHVALGKRDGFVARAPADPAIVAATTFTRNAHRSWGTAATGGMWQVSPRDAFSTNGEGRIDVIGGVGERSANLRDVAARDVSLVFTATLDELPSGGSVYLQAVARKVGTSEYRARLRIKPDGSMLVRLIRRSPTSGWQPIGNDVLIEGLTVAAGVPFRVGLDVSGDTTSTLLRVRAWPVGTDAPAWQVEVDDADTDVVGAGTIGVRASLPTALDSVTISIDDLSAATG